MSFVAQLAHLPAALPPYRLTATVIVLAATATLINGLVRNGRSFVRHLPSIIYLWAGSAAFWSVGTESLRLWNRAAVVVATVALSIEVLRAYRERIDCRDLDLGSLHMARRYVMATLLIAVGLLLYHLGTYSGALLTWEAPVVAGYPKTGGFAEAYNTGQSVLAYTAQRFLWDEGLLSAGHTSLFYGAPTYALFHLVGFSAWSLRVASVIATLLSIVLIYLLASRFFGAVVGGAAAVALGLNSCVLFYGRYGSSPAGTLCAVLLAVWCTWRFLESERPAWWTGPACAAALYVATLQYSPGRIVVLILLGFLTITLTRRWRHLPWQQVAGCAVIIVVAAGVWRLQCSFATQDTFLMARGEQYFDLIQNPESIQELFDQDLLGRPVTQETITWRDKLELAYRVVQTTLPQYVDVMRPLIETVPLTDVRRRGALPQLYYAPLALFIIWGFTHSLLRLRAWPHACLVAWLAVGTLPLLLTNRIDSHRIMLFVIPLSIWGGLGAWEAARVLADAQVPLDVQQFFAALVALTMLYSDVHLLHRVPPPNPVGNLAAEAATVQGHVIVGALYKHPETAWLELAMLERTRRDRTQSGKMLDERTLRQVQDRAAQPEARADALRSLLDHATVFLAPADRFRRITAALQARGVRVAEREIGKRAYLRLDVGTTTSGGGDAVVHPSDSTEP